MIKMNNKELLESIDNRLKTLLKLRAKDYLEEDSTTKEKVKKLYKMGLTNGEMAEIIDTSKSSVSGTVSHLRSKGEIE
jgi:Mn-dependent DtxR family transcriptional regulator